MSGATIHQLPTRPHRAKVVDLNPPHRPPAEPKPAYYSGARIFAADHLATELEWSIDEAGDLVDLIIGWLDQENDRIARRIGGAS